MGTLEPSIITGGASMPRVLNTIIPIIPIAFTGLGSGIPISSKKNFYNGGNANNPANPVPDTRPRPIPRNDPRFPLARQLPA